jgi:molybdopterin converting factor small subunit
VQQVTVLLPPALLSLFPTVPRRVELAASTVGEAIEALNARWPGLRDRLCDSTPRIRRNINVFVGGRRAVLATPLPPGAEMVIMTAVTG